MLVRICFLVVLLGVLPGGAAGQSDSIFQLVGFTSQEVRGSEGRFTFNEVCQAQWEGTRMCTTQEVIQTVEVPVLGEGPALVQAVPISASGSLIDASGISLGSFRYNTCVDWSSDNGSPLVVTNTGHIQEDESGYRPSCGVDSGAFQCSCPLPVACCGLVPITPQPPPSAASVPLWVLPLATGGLLGAGVLRAGKRRKRQS